MHRIDENTAFLKQNLPCSDYYNLDLCIYIPKEMNQAAQQKVIGGGEKKALLWPNIALSWLNIYNVAARISAAIILLLGCIAVQAQEIVVRNFPQTAYDGDRQNWAIGQDAAGRMLFGNGLGLLIFDGSSWTLLPVPNHTCVHSLKFDSRRNLIFVGASNEFGYFTPDSETKSLLYHSLSALLPKNQDLKGEIWNIRIEGGQVYFESKEYVFVADKQLKSVSRHKLTKPYQHWVGHELLIGKTIRGVTKIGQNYIIATASDGLYIYNGKEITPYQIDITPYLKANEVFCMAAQGSIVAFGTVKGGVVVKNLQTGRTSYSTIQTGLGNNTVLSLYFDSTDNLWAGLDNGVAYLLPRMSYRELFATPQNNIGTGYTSCMVGKTMYFGTNQGLFVAPLYDNGIVEGQRQMVGNIIGQVWNLRYIDGVLLCAADKGAFVVNGTTAKQIQGMQGAWNFRELKQHKGFIVASDYNGLLALRRSGDGYEVYARLVHYGEGVSNFEVDTDGTLWVCQWLKGVSHYAFSDDMKSLRLLGRYGKNHGLFVDEGNFVVKIDGRVYVSSVDGLYSYNSKTRQLTRDDAMSKVFNSFDTSINIRQMSDGSLWAYKKGFLSHATKDAHGQWIADKTTFMSIERRLQIGMVQPNEIAAGVTCFGANNGFVTIDSHQKPASFISRPIVSSIIATTVGQESLYCFDYTQNSDTRVSIPPECRSIRIDYALPEYREEQAVAYSVWMEGFDNGWSDYGYQTAKEYKLSRGNYTFHVKARNMVTGDESETQIKLTVTPYWYETWYAYTLYAIMIVILLTIISNYLYTRKLHKIAEAKKDAELKLTVAQNDMLEMELKHKHSELVDSTQNIVHNNEILQEIDMRLDTLSEQVRREEPKAAITKAIANVRQYIQQNIDNDDHWDQFEESFNLIYDNFMVQLRQRYPILKKNDLKLCAYLRMGLSSKEIASLLGVSERSVETARYRLRKKLELKQGDSLIEFLNQ